ncbi:uncharacterized protein LOC135479520 isoform X2 [Liolophura sinensis]|uniref:uncharacterized protein LOC135479520 isoform X2 n=1 Tax=Liolophura sinensis TaxID=3198878 RepID=UPI00315898C1
MALRSDIIRWLTLGIFATTILMLGQLAWVVRDKDPRSVRKPEKILNDLVLREHATDDKDNEDNDNKVRNDNQISYNGKINEPFGSRSCIPDPKMISTMPRRPYKIFIYDLPRKFNYDVLECVKKDDCFDLDYCGMGQELFRVGNVSVRNTNQFALEVILHHQLLFSPYRVLDPSEADIFYIPAYTGLSCFCRRQTGTTNTRVLITELFHWLNLQKPYRNGKLHMSALAKIEREQASDRCPLLTFPQARNIVYATIEEEADRSHKHYLNLTGHSVVVVPYPSYGHIVSGSSQLDLSEPLLSIPPQDRKVFILLAAGSRKSNPFRVKLMSQFDPKSRTKSSYDNFFSRSANEDTDMVFLYTQECQDDHQWTTIPWMQHSVFCLQPPGDSPTRKSFYDAIMAGCIPVLFKDHKQVNYPFQDVLDYKKFTVTLSYSDIDRKRRLVRDLLERIPQKEIQSKLNAIQKVAAKLQYSLPVESSSQLKGATQLLMKEIGYYFATWQLHKNNPEFYNNDQMD